MTNVDPDQASGVSSGVGAGATIAIKNGWLPLDSGGRQVNSIGAIHGDGRDDVVAVLTDGQATEADGIDAIEGLSDLIWKELAPSGTGAEATGHKSRTGAVHSVVTRPWPEGARWRNWIRT